MTKAPSKCSKRTTSDPSLSPHPALLQLLKRLSSPARSCSDDPPEDWDGEEACVAAIFLRFERSIILALFSFCLLFPSPGMQRWQNLQAKPSAQPCLCTKAQGLQFPRTWPEDPKLGISGQPGAGCDGGCDGGRGETVAVPGNLLAKRSGMGPAPVSTAAAPSVPTSSSTLGTQAQPA